jgi:nucleobase transporter 1/2
LQGDRVRVVQTLLFVTGINTLLQSLFGTRLPTVIGGSYAFVIPIMAIVQDSSLTAITDNHEVSSHSHFRFYPHVQLVFCPLLIWSCSWNSFICSQRFLQSMRAIQGALIVSSSIQIILGYSQLWGIFSRYYFTMPCSSRSNNVGCCTCISVQIRCCRGSTDGWVMGLTFRFFSPVGMAPVVALLGFGLFERGFPVVWRCSVSDSSFGVSHFLQER